MTLALSHPISAGGSSLADARLTLFIFFQSSSKDPPRTRIIPNYDHIFFIIISTEKACSSRLLPYV